MRLVLRNWVILDAILKILGRTNADGALLSCDVTEFGQGDNKSRRRLARTYLV
jgi:hypothetical protein